MAGMADNTGNIYENIDFFVRMARVCVGLEQNRFRDLLKAV